MITVEDINRIIGITESFQLPEKLMSLLLSSEKNKILKQFNDLESDMSFDWFTNYFQEEHSNRNAMMQDFTPKELAQLLPKLHPSGYSKVLDICSGTGGLTIGVWNYNHDAEFYCEELSERAFPLLLFNLSVRNISGYAVNKNVLSGEVLHIYRLTAGEEYSEIEEVENYPDENDFDLIVSNPPYSLKFEWDDLPDWLQGYEPPTKAADYAFVLYGISKLSANGKMYAILPHGVLFRGQKEGAIRQKLLTDGLISEVIGLPEKLFLNTQIPVCILGIGKAGNVYFVDASKAFEKNAKQNRLRSEDCEKIIEAVRSRSDVDKYARIIYSPEIKNNDYNLNIPRYVDTSEEEPLPELGEILRNIWQTEQELRKTELSLAEMLNDISADDPEDRKILKELKKYYNRKDKKNEGQLFFDL